MPYSFRAARSGVSTTSTYSGMFAASEGGVSPAGVSTMLGRKPVVKLANTVERLPLHGDVPEALRRRRAELKFDYGKFDFIMENGAPVLLDANSTPHEGRIFPTPPRETAICAALAEGLGAYLA